MTGDGVHSVCQSQRHEPIRGSLELVDAEEGGMCFPSCVERIINCF